MIRALVNRYDSWLFDDHDAFGGIVRFLSMALIVLAVVALLMAGIAALIVSSGPAGPPNGCKVGHYEGVKPAHFVCDEWYPPPQVRPQ